MSAPTIKPALVAIAIAAKVCCNELPALPVTPLPAVPDAHGFAGAFAGIHQHQLLAGGGANFPNGVMPWEGGTKVWHDRLFALDLNSPNAGWREVGKLPAPNGYGASLTIREGVLLIGGSDATRHFTDVALLTLDAQGKPQFRSLPALPMPLAQMAAACVGRNVHVLGGIDSPNATSASNKHWQLDLDALDKGWQAQPELPAPGRILATTATIDGAFYVMGGCSLHADATGKPARSYLRDAWKFSNGAWQRLADMPRAAVAAASPAPTAGTACFVVSGDDGAQAGLASPAEHKGFTKEVLKYDASSNTWSTVGELTVPAPVTLAIAPWQDGFIFFNGEVRPGVRTTQVFSFQPPH